MKSNVFLRIDNCIKEAKKEVKQRRKEKEARQYSTIKVAISQLKEEAKKIEEAREELIEELREEEYIEEATRKEEEAISKEEEEAIKEEFKKEVIEETLQAQKENFKMFHREEFFKEEAINNNI